MVSETVSFVLFVIVAVIICAGFAVVVFRSLRGKGCSCGNKQCSCMCGKDHCCSYGKNACMGGVARKP
ncbi:MAG TPA: hypothetical protein O0X50_01260 [Methanocorpusculum sp.]|nr:hypothetical protein [Methanocorpusculum sp.]